MTVVSSVVQHKSEVVIVVAGHLLEAASVCDVVLVDSCEHIRAPFPRVPLAAESQWNLGRLEKVPIAPLTLNSIIGRA